MNPVVSQTASAPSSLASEALTGLPGAFVVLDLGDAAAVIGPTGVFLVSPGGGDPSAVASWLAVEAHRLRSVIAEHLVPAPFIEAVVVAEGECPPAPRAAVIPAEMLLGAILDSGVSLPQSDVPVVATALDGAHLRLI